MEAALEALAPSIATMPPMLLALVLIIIVIWQLHRLVEMMHRLGMDCLGQGIPIRVTVVHEDEEDPPTEDGE